MSPYADPIPALKSEVGAFLADVVRSGNGDDLGALLGTDRFRIADLRRGRLARFSLETPLRLLVSAGMHVEPPRDTRAATTAAGTERSSRTLSRARTEAAPRRPGVWSASRGNAAQPYRQHCTGRAEDPGRLGA
jgi:hypothetical protein